MADFFPAAAHQESPEAQVDILDNFRHHLAAGPLYHQVSQEENVVSYLSLDVPLYVCTTLLHCIICDKFCFVRHLAVMREDSIE